MEPILCKTRIIAHVLMWDGAITKCIPKKLSQRLRAVKLMPKIS